MFWIIELIFSCIGLYGFFMQVSICALIGVIGIIICDFIDVILMGHNPTTIIVAIIGGVIATTIYNANALDAFTVWLCGENFIITIFGLITMILGLIMASKSISNSDKYEKLSNIFMQGADCTTIDEALEKAYYFYNNRGVDLANVKIDPDNKYKTLSEIVMLGIEANDIDNAIKELTEFYESKGITIS